MPSHVCTGSYMQQHAANHTCMSTFPFILSHAHADRHKHMHALKHTGKKVNACVSTGMHTQHVCIQAHAHTHAHTYIHTQAKAKAG